VVLGGDLRQTLPVIEGGSRSEIVNSAIVNSSLWSHVVVLHLRINMRLSTDTLTKQGRKELADFSRWLLDIGESNIETIAKEGESESSWIEVPEEFLLRPVEIKFHAWSMVYTQIWKPNIWILAISKKELY
jgi:hypothetical protein